MVRLPVAEVAVALGAGDGAVLSGSLDGPELLSALPTTIGVGVTRGLVAKAGSGGGIEFVTTTTLTGVGVGSTPDCENADDPRMRRDRDAHKNFIFIR